MTHFYKKIIVTEEQKNWIVNEFKKLDSGEGEVESYYSDYYHDYGKYHDEETRLKRLKEIDDDNIEYIKNTENYSESQRKESLEQFLTYLTTRNDWEREIKKYKKQYEPLGFCIDNFPNFLIEIRKKTNRYFIEFQSHHEKYERSHNPIMLAIFLQKFIIQFNMPVLAFYFLEDAEESFTRHAGIVKITQTTIKIYSLDKLVKRCEKIARKNTK